MVGRQDRGAPVTNGDETIDGELFDPAGTLAPPVEAAVTVEREPEAAATIFGDNVALACRYVQWLAGPGAERGLMGPREAARLWTRHVLNSAVLAEAVPSDVRVVDVGSGAGLPGIPLALARPDLRIDLVETLQRRAEFLGEVVDSLGLGDRVRVIRGRAEEVVAEVGGANVVTARAVAPLGKLAGWCAPLLQVGGLFAVLKGASAQSEIERDEESCRRVGIEGLEVREVGRGLLEEPTTLVVGTRGQVPAHADRDSSRHVPESSDGSGRPKRRRVRGKSRADRRST